MKDKINNTLKKILNKSHNLPLNLLLNKNQSSNDKKNKLLFNYKSSLEVLLNNIKYFQLDYLSEQSKKNKKITKKNLSLLKNDLNMLLLEKNKQYNYFKEKNEISKNNLQLILFPSSEENKELNNNTNLENNIITSVIEKEQLQLLNFQMQNEINKTNFLIEQKKQINSYIESIPFFIDDTNEIVNNNNYENNQLITGFFNQIIRRVRNQFIEVVKNKFSKELEINSISYQINNTKKKIENCKLIGFKKYIETEKIIQEESKEYNNSFNTSQSKRNSISSIDKDIIKTINNKPSTDIKTKNKKKERIINDQLQRRNIFYTKKINNNIFNIKNNNVNKYLNMNINVNINLNNNNSIYNNYNSSLDSGNFNRLNENIEQYEMDLNDNNKIIITPITTIDNNDNKNNINNNDSLNKESNKNDESFILSINSE